MEGLVGRVGQPGGQRGPADPAALARSLEAELARLGVPGPAVEVGLVDHLERQATGKLRRFLPLAPAAASLPA
jgi:hypothetical protein